jgi:hypothetical protein
MPKRVAIRLEKMPIRTSKDPNSKNKWTCSIESMKSLQSPYPRRAGEA